MKSKMTTAFRIVLGLLVLLAAIMIAYMIVETVVHH